MVHRAYRITIFPRPSPHRLSSFDAQSLETEKRKPKKNGPHGVSREDIEREREKV